MENIFSIGLDLGTTTISAVVVDTRDGTVLARKTEKSEADLRSSVPGEKMQSSFTFSDSGFLLHETNKHAKTKTKTAICRSLFNIIFAPFFIIYFLLFLYSPRLY